MLHFLFLVYYSTANGFLLQRQFLKGDYTIWERALLSIALSLSLNSFLLYVLIGSTAIELHQLNVVILSFGSTALMLVLLPFLSHE